MKKLQLVKAKLKIRSKPTFGALKERNGSIITGIGQVDAFEVSSSLLEELIP